MDVKPEHGPAPADVARFVEHFGLLLADSGMPRMPSRVFACLLADANGSLTAGELAERLQVSPAAISGAVRYLVPTRLVVKAREPGNRVDHYTVSDNVWHDMYAARTSLLKHWEDGLSEGVALFGDDHPAGCRLRESRAFFGFLRNELAQSMERWQVYRTTLHHQADPPKQADPP